MLGKKTLFEIINVSNYGVHKAAAPPNTQWVNTPSLKGFVREEPRLVEIQSGISQNNYFMRLALERINGDKTSKHFLDSPCYAASSTHFPEFDVEFRVFGGVKPKEGDLARMKYHEGGSDFFGSIDSLEFAQEPLDKISFLLESYDSPYATYLPSGTLFIYPGQFRIWRDGNKRIFRLTCDREACNTEKYPKFVLKDRDFKGIDGYEIKDRSIAAYGEYVYPQDYESPCPVTKDIPLSIGNLVSYISVTKDENILKIIEEIKEALKT